MATISLLFAKYWAIILVGTHAAAVWAGKEWAKWKASKLATDLSAVKKDL